MWWEEEYINYMALEEIQNCYGELFRCLDTIRDESTLRASSLLATERRALVSAQPTGSSVTPVPQACAEGMAWSTTTFSPYCDQQSLKEAAVLREGIWVPPIENWTHSIHPGNPVPPERQPTPSCSIHGQVYCGSSWGQTTSCLAWIMTAAAHIFKPVFVTRRAWNSFLKQTLS